jgi:hypothetical protein
MKPRKKTVLLLVVAAVLVSTVAPAVTAAPASLPSDAVKNTADEQVDVWEASLLPLRIDRSTAATQVTNPDFRVDKVGGGERSFGKATSGIFTADDTLSMEFDDARAGTSALANEDVQVIAVRIRGNTSQIPTTYAEATGLLSDDATPSNARYYDVGTTTLDAEGTANLNFTVPTSGHYTFLTVSSPSNVSVSTGSVSLSGDVTIVGIDAATVQSGTGSADVNGVTAAPSPGDGIAFDVDSTDALGTDSGVTQVVVVYKEDQLVGSSSTISAASADIGPTFDSTSQTRLTTSAAPVGVASVDADARAGGVALADGTVARQANVQGLVDYVAENGSAAAPNGSDVVYASVNATTGAAADGSVLVGTTADWEPGTYRYVYVSQLDDDGTVLTSSTDTLSVEVNPFDNSTVTPGSSPRDLDGDGRYEDVNGDGVADFSDVIDFLFEIDSIEDEIENGNLTTQQQAALNYNGQGSVDFIDVVELLFTIL